MDTEQLTNSKNLICIGNPFASPTEEAIGDYFVGRKSVLAEMHRDIVCPNRISNYHIVGLPRIGKSSLLKAFRGMVLENHYNLDLIVIYISLDKCDDSKSMWRMIGKELRKELKKKFGSNQKYISFEEELEFEGLDDNNIDYEYVCSVAKCMKVAGFLGLVLIDEFDNFSSIATKGTVGNLRTLFSSADYGVRAVIASRRMVERIEREVEGAVNSDVSTLAPIFINGCKLMAFNEEDMNEYWKSIANKIGCSISEKYIQEVHYYVGNHPCLLNLLNGAYWAEHESSNYICDNSEGNYLNLSKKIVNELHDEFNWAVWREMKKWQLLRSLILYTWGPDENIPKEELSELVRYGIVDPDQILTEPNGPIRIAISRYFTEWMNLKRYILPFGDEWSKAEGNMRNLIRSFCDDVYQGDETMMIEKLETKYTDSFEVGVDPRYTAKGRFDSMRKKMTKNMNKYPNMSSSLIDYSDPSDLPEIFFKREWSWFGQVFGKSWNDWREKFYTINEVRNIKAHNNAGIPQVRIELAKKYCHEINEKIEFYLQSKKEI
jgi:hypothetical protein